MDRLREVADAGPGAVALPEADLAQADLAAPADALPYWISRHPDAIR
jgi:hypothetical protein